MREMKDSGIEWVPRIPESWNSKKAKYNFENTKYIPGVRSVEYDRLALTMKGVIHRSKDDADGLQPKDFLTYQLLRKGELVFKLIDLQNVTTSRVGLAHDTGLVSPAYIILKATGELLPEFAEKYFFMLWHREIFNALGDNGVRSNLNATDLLNVPICYPSIEEQKAVIAFLDSKCAEIDALSADIQSEIDALEAYKRSVITEAVTKGLDKTVPMKDSGIEWVGEIPAMWIMQRGEYVFKQESDNGNSKALVLLSPTQNYGVVPQELYEELSGFSAVKLNEKTDYNSLKTVHKGAFVISLRSFQGGFEYSEYEGVISSAYQVFYPVTPVYDGYYKYLFKTQIFIDKMNSYTMSLRDGKNIAFADFGRTYIPFPPVEEQSSIAQYLDDKCAEIDSIIAQKQEQLAVLADYKKSVIYEYVTGKKEVPVA